MPHSWTEQRLFTRLEGKGWSFFGRTVQLTNEDDDNEILDDILSEGAFDGTEAE